PRTASCLHSRRAQRPWPSASRCSRTAIPATIPPSSAPAPKPVPRATHGSPEPGTTPSALAALLPAPVLLVELLAHRGVLVAIRAVVGAGALLLLRGHRMVALVTIRVELRALRGKLLVPLVVPPRPPLLLRGELLPAATGPLRGGRSRRDE